MKKSVIVASLLTVSPLTAFISSCSSCEHIKGQIQEICVANHKHIDRCGAYNCLKGDHTFFATINPEDINTPIVNLKGDLKDVSRDTKKKIEIEILTPDHTKDYDVDATIKIQGNTSSWFPKKNFNIELFKKGTEDKQKIKFKDTWPKINKFTLKAGWTDEHHLRNIGLSLIWGQIVKAHGSHYKKDYLFDSFNGGATDGFPILVYNNNNFLGSYQLIVPKSKHLSGMKDDEGDKTIHHAMFAADGYNDVTSLSQPIDPNKPLDEQALGLKHNSIEDDDSWWINSFNKLINFIKTSPDSEFDSQISTYVDLGRTLDYMAFIDMFFCPDNVSKNINWCTFDENIWTPIPWDLDCSFGYGWVGNRDYYNYDASIYFAGNSLFNRIYTLKKAEYQANFKELRQEILSPSNIMHTLFDFDLQANPLCYDADIRKWPNCPDKADDYMYYLNNFITKRWNWFEQGGKE